MLILLSINGVCMELSFRASVVKGSDLRVSDVIEGASDFNQQRWPEELKNWVSQEQVSNWLVSQMPGSEINSSKDIQWHGRKKAWIQHCFSPQLGAIEPELKQRLIAQHHLLAETINISFQEKNLPCIEQPVDTITLVSVQSGNSNHITLRLELSGENGELTRIPMQAIVDAEVNALQLQKNVVANTPLSLAKTKVQRQKWTGKQYSADNNLNSVQFQKARKSGDIVKNRDLEERFPVNVGDLVKVLLQKGAIRIETKGKAMDNAGIGETLRIKVESSQKLSDAQVLAEGVVLVKV